MSKFLLRDSSGRSLAIVCAEPPSVDPVSEDADVRWLKSWLNPGVPSARGMDIGSARVEVPITVPASDPLWGLAVLDESERLGMTLEEQTPAVAAADFDETKHPRVGKGHQHGGQFSKKAIPDAEEETEERAKVYPKKVIDTSMLTKVGGSLGGSTPAEQFKDSDGNVWYVKHVKSPMHSVNEVLAARLYAAAGVDVPEIQRTTDGKIASKVMKLMGSADVTTPGAAQGFAADAWLANWDAVGKGYDNLQIAADGKAVRVDVGGSLVYRAQGGSKAEYFNGTADEINSLRDPNGPNPQSSKIFSSLSPEQVKDSINATVANVTDKQINSIIDEFAPMGIGSVNANELKSRLKARRDALIKLAGETKTTTKVAKTEGAPNVKGKIFQMGKLPFATTGYNELADIEYEKKPKLPRGPQTRCMKEASANAKKGFTTDNWDDPAHPRPDADGVPTNKHSHEFQRLFSVGRSMCSAWKSSAQSEGASALKRAAIRVFNARGIVWNNSSTDTDDQRWDNDRAIRMMYRDTQERLAASGVTEHDRFVLFRGINQQCTNDGVLEGHSLSQSKASSFNGHDVVKRWVNPVEVLVDNHSKYFEGTGFHNESEWFVFAGGFGSPASEKQSAKVKTESAAKSGIVDYSGGKPAKITPLMKIAKMKAVPHEQAEATGQVQANKWAEVTDEKILKVKEMHASGHSTSSIKHALNMAPSTIHGIVHGLTKKYATTGARSAHMKKLLEISGAQWDGIKKDAAAHLAAHGKVDFNAVGAKHGVKGWKAQAVYFSKPKFSEVAS